MIDPTIANPPAIEIEAESENQIKANKLFQNIEKLKEEKKTLSSTINDLLSRDSDYSNLLEEKRALAKKIKQAKLIATTKSNQIKKLEEDKKELASEIKNDTSILNDFIQHSVQIGEQMRLFDLEREEHVALPNYKLKKKKDL